MANAKSLRFDLDLVEALGRRLQPDAMIVQEDRNLVMAGAGLSRIDVQPAGGRLRDQRTARTGTERR